jgi:hypothetical protein
VIAIAERLNLTEVATVDRKHFSIVRHATRRRPGRRKPFEVRWRAAGRSKSKSFITRKLADSYRAELVRAARMGLDFDPLTGEPTAWNLPEPAIVTCYEEAAAYAVMKWPALAAHSRASLAEALATVTPALIRPGVRDRPDQRELRTALYQHAFNPARPADPGSPAAQVLDWAQQASLPVGCLSEPAVLRTALEALSLRLDGSRAAANTIIRKRGDAVRPQRQRRARARHRLAQHRVLPRLDQPDPQLLAVGRVGPRREGRVQRPGGGAQQKDTTGLVDHMIADASHISLLVDWRTAGGGWDAVLPGPRLTSGRYEPLVQDEAQVGVHPSSVSHLRGALAAAVSMTSTAPRSNGSSSRIRVGVAVCMTYSFSHHWVTWW